MCQSLILFSSEFDETLAAGGESPHAGLPRRPFDPALPVVEQGGVEPPADCLERAVERFAASLLAMEGSAGYLYRAACGPGTPCGADDFCCSHRELRLRQAGDGAPQVAPCGAPVVLAK